MREISYRAEGIRTRKTYRILRNMRYEEGYPETMVGESRRHLETSELEQADRHSGIRPLELPENLNFQSKAQCVELCLKLD